MTARFVVCGCGLFSVYLTVLKKTIVAFSSSICVSVFLPMCLSDTHRAYTDSTLCNNLLSHLLGRVTSCLQLHTVGFSALWKLVERGGGTRTRTEMLTGSRAQTLGSLLQRWAR